jgi:hypothetical protein
MSRSVHRERGDAAEAWRVLLFGALVRAVDEPVVVRAGPLIRLPRSGRWETGLARLRPALDDALGSTGLAVAWRWACAETGGNAWPSLELVARKATDRDVTAGVLTSMARFEAACEVVEDGGAVRWELQLPGRVVSVGLSSPREADFRDVDLVANVAAAWLDLSWRRVG